MGRERMQQAAESENAHAASSGPAPAPRRPDLAGQIMGLGAAAGNQAVVRLLRDMAGDRNSGNGGDGGGPGSPDAGVRLDAGVGAPATATVSATTMFSAASAPVLVARQTAPDTAAAAPAASTDPAAAAQDSAAARVVEAFKTTPVREQILRACLAAGGQWARVQELWSQADMQVSLLDMAGCLERGKGDAARVYAYLRFGDLRLADKLFIAGIGAGTDEDTIFRLLPAVRAQLDATSADFENSYSKSGGDAFGAEYTATAPLTDGTPNRIAGFLDDEMSGADLVKATALLTYGVVRPVDEIEIAKQSPHLFRDGIMAALDKVHLATPDGTRPPAEEQYTASYHNDLRGVLGAELGTESKDYRRARMILDGDFTPLHRIQLACEAWVVDTEEIWAALTAATPAQLDSTGAQIRQLVADKWTISDADRRRIDALLRHGTTMDERLQQLGVTVEDTQGVVQAALAHAEVREAFRAEYRAGGDFYSRFTGNGQIGAALLWGGQLVSADWREQLRLAVQMESAEGVISVLASSVATDEARAQIRGDQQLMGQLQQLDAWKRIEPMIEPRDDPAARAQWLAQKFDREQGWWGGTAAAAAFGDEQRSLQAALATAADPHHLTEQERARIAPLLGQAETALDTFIQVRDELDAYAIQTVGIVAGLVATALTAGAAGPVTASLLARVALAQAVASVATVRVVKGGRATAGEEVRAFAVGAVTGATGVLASGPVTSLLSQEAAQAAATQTAEIAAAVAEREFAGTGLGTLKAAMESAAGGAAGNAVDSATRSETWRGGFVQGLGTVLGSAAQGAAQGAAVSGAFEGIKSALFGTGVRPGGGGPGGASGGSDASGGAGGVGGVGVGARVPDAAMVLRARILLESGESIAWEKWTGEVLPSFGADEAAARQALGRARAAIVADAAARAQAELQPLGVVLELPTGVEFDAPFEITVRPADASPGAAGGAGDAALAQALAAVERELAGGPAGRLGAEAVAGGVRGTDVYQSGESTMGPNGLDKAIQRQVIGEGNWAVPGTTAVRVDTNHLTITVPPETTGTARIVDVRVLLADSGALPSAHPAAGGSEAGPGRLQLVPPTSPDLVWTATVWVDAALLPENVRFVVGHELDEIAVTVRRLGATSGATAADVAADVAAEGRAGIFTRAPEPNAQPTAHDVASAVELFELHEQLMATLGELRQAQKQTQKTGDGAKIQEFTDRARRRIENMTRLTDWMALDQPANMDAKIRVLQQNGSGAEWAEFVEELRETGGSAALARLAAAAPGGAVTPGIGAGLLGHLMYPVERTGGEFRKKGIDGGHSDPELRAFTDQPGSVLRVVQESAKAAGGNMFRKYAQYEWTGTGPAPAAGDPAAPAPGAATPPGWVRSDQWKTTAQDFHAFVDTVNTAVHDHIAAGNPLPVEGQVPMTTADGVTIVVWVRNGAVDTVYVNENWF